MDGPFLMVFRVFDQVFEELRHNSPDVLNKLVPIAGDMSLPALGISPSDVKILSDNVTVVFHSAATVKFDQTLKSAVEMNLKGTMQLIQLVRKLERLEVQTDWFLFLSQDSGIIKDFGCLIGPGSRVDSLRQLRQG